MNKILIVSCVFPPEPVVSAKLSCDIAERFHSLGKEVVVISPKPSRPLNYKFLKKSDSFPFKHIVLNSYTCASSDLWGRFKESRSFGRSTYRYIQEHCQEIDAIYANTWPLFAQFYLAKVAQKHGIPYYIHVQDIYPESYCKKMPKVMGHFLYCLLKPIDKYVLCHARGVIAISPSMKDYLLKSRNLDQNKVELVRNWQNDKAYIDAYKPIEEMHKKVNVMYLGSINPTANVTLILQAFSNLDNEKYCLNIIGNGPEKEKCQELANKLGIMVSFDSVTPDMVAKKQSEADVLVLCLKKGVAQTATPSKLTAYMLSGRPIIASVDTDSDCAKIIRESGSGIVVEPDNTQDLRDAIQRIANLELEELRIMGAKAYHYALKHLSKEQNLNKLIYFIEND